MSHSAERGQRANGADRKSANGEQPKPVEHPLAEPQWEVGKHDWRGSCRCSICWVERSRDGAWWVPTLVPCVPRLVEQVFGFYTTAEAAMEIGISRSVFTRRIHCRAIAPAAVSRTGAHYWRWDQLSVIARAEDQRDEPRGSRSISQQAADLHAIIISSVQVGRPLTADEMADLCKEVSRQMTERLRPEMPLRVNRLV